MKKKLKFHEKLCLTLVMAFFYLPIIYLVVFSFNESKSLSHFTGFSLKWYARMLANRSVTEAIWCTLLCAVLATAISTVVGTVTAIGLSKCRKSLKDFVLQISHLQIVSLDIVTAIGLMLLFTSLRVKTGFTTMLLAHISFCTPYVILSVLPKLRSLDPNTIDAAMDLGCTPAQTLTRVIIPQIRPGIVAGALVAFSMSFDDFVISLFTSGPGVNNISMYVYANVKRANPTINALSAMIVYVVTIVLVLMNLVPVWREKRKKRRALREEN